MKNLWMTLPPPRADHYGLMEIIKGSDGCAVMDDSGAYRPGGSHGYGGGGGGHGYGGGGHGGFEGGRGGHGGRGGGKGGGAARVVVSGASSQDVTTGTREILLRAFQEAQSRYDPRFVLFGAGPCGAMIGTDLGEIAEAVSAQYHIPAAAVDLTGQKTYDVGLSKTTEALVKLLAQPGEVIPGAVNVLGASALDWAQEDVDALNGWAARQGARVLAQPGGTVTADQLASMGRAQLNLAVTVSGLAAARELERRFGTPYLALSPFGAARQDLLARALEGAPLPQRELPAQTDALVIGEQLTANAAREVLEDAGAVQGADVMTFYQLDKACARPGDRRLKGEADAKELLGSGRYRVIAGDPLLRPLTPRDCVWIDLPHRALNTYSDQKSAPLLGSALDDRLARRGQ